MFGSNRLWLMIASLSATSSRQYCTQPQASVNTETGNGAAKSIAVDHAGGALWVPPEDSKALTTAIKTLMNNPTQRQELGTKGQTFLGNGFTRAQIAERCAERLQELLGS